MGVARATPTRLSGLGASEIAPGVGCGVAATVTGKLAVTPKPPEMITGVVPAPEPLGPTVSVLPLIEPVR